jgi:hypothetical protein
MGCPAERPFSGDACSVPNQECSYGGYCGVEVGPTMLCQEGYWRQAGQIGSCNIPQCGVPEVDASDGAPNDGGGDEAQPDGSLPACSWPAPVQPSDAGLIVVAAGRTVLWCGVGNVNNIECLSTRATECSPEAVYDYAVCNYPQCSPCMMLCAPNEYGIGVGGILSAEGPQVPVPSSSVPSNCRSVRSGMLWPVDGRSPGREWSYSCCPCE